MTDDESSTAMSADQMIWADKPFCPPWSVSILCIKENFQEQGVQPGPSMQDRSVHLITQTSFELERLRDVET